MAVTDIDSARAQKIAKDRIDVEVFVNAVYGYDIQCEVVGETGVAPPARTIQRPVAKRSVEILTDWKKRFIESYDVELQEWIHSVASGKIGGPSSWDGYAAAVTADACVEAQNTGKIVEIKLGSLPACTHLAARKKRVSKQNWV
jgi:myo-inositol 2-dehydrogenase / D-chiro-inositol 1-dehydrogenase